MKKLLLISIIFLSGCHKDNVDPSVGPITLEFDNKFTDDLTLTIDYDVSDISLTRDDNVVYADGPKSYHVSEADEGSQEISLKNLKAGTYTQVMFTINNLKISGSFTANIQTANVVLAMPSPGAPVRAEHEPEAHLIFDMNKLKDGSDIQSAITVDHIHAN